ncbi:MAG: hypothetical protein CM15mP65_08260 [Crocinitomicaceae bacterium]|nr:MAG: hypothetical protein CM15mP65_08260 [Crocinitomicaceae bacterium]
MNLLLSLEMSKLKKSLTGFGDKLIYEEAISSIPVGGGGGGGEPHYKVNW